jgi:uncharacterized protein YacL
MQIIEIVLLVVIITILLLRQKPKQLKSKTTRKVILDTCALIDGRIVDLSNTGFVPDQLIVPEFIISELQMLADGNDSHKRERARFGLDVVKELKTSKYCSVIVDESFLKDDMLTDDKLVALALKLNCPLYTTDFNLNKVADIKGVKVLNVNELAQELRPSVLPGEKRNIKILQKGSNPSQGVGYLDDGTMIVIENGAKLMGKTVEVEIERSFQTVAGKMLFAQLTNKPSFKPNIKNRNKTAKSY